MSGDGLTAPDAVVEAALAASRSMGCVVLVEDRSAADVRFAVNTTTTNGVRRSRTVTVASVAEVTGGLALGVASRSGAVDVGELVTAAEAEALRAPVADDAAPLLGGASDDAFSDAPGMTSLSALGDVLGALRGAFERAERAGTELSGFASHEVATTYLGTSEGLRRRHEQPTGTLELVARTTDGSSSSWVGAATRAFEDVSVAALEDELARRLGWARRRVEVAPGRHRVVLPPSAVADLTALLTSSLGGQEAHDGRTAFSAPGGGTRVGERLAARPFELRSDPGEPGLACTPFATATSSSDQASVFDNGLALPRTSWIRDGRLEHLRYHRAGAARHGTEPTPQPDNLVLALDGATGTTDDLVARTERGLLVTCLWYIRMVDPASMLLTGLTRDGVYAVEDGKVVGSVTNFRFNESPLGVLDRAADVGATVPAFGRELGQYLPRMAMPPIAVDAFNMSSVSPAR